jgi:hypothetical protein
MIALDTWRLAGTSPFYNETLDSPLCKVHRQAQADRATTNDQHLSLTGFAHTRFTLLCPARLKRLPDYFRQPARPMAHSRLHL